jgi:hypothetical protein
MVEGVSIASFGACEGDTCQADADLDGVCDDLDLVCNVDEIPLSCRMLPPDCMPGLVPEMVGGCYTGACLSWDECFPQIDPGGACGPEFPECPRGHYCDFPPETMCGATGIPGICSPIDPIFCTEEYDPVCGCNGQTYSNECFARSASVSISHFGECGNIACGGFAGIMCPMGMICMDDPSDDCDPNRNGADCIGICRPEF